MPISFGNLLTGHPFGSTHRIFICCFTISGAVCDFLGKLNAFSLKSTVTGTLVECGRPQGRIMSGFRGIIEVSGCKRFDSGGWLRSEGAGFSVDFLGPFWCGPCQSGIAAHRGQRGRGLYAGKLKVAKVNVDQNSATPRRATAFAA